MENDTKDIGLFLVLSITMQHAACCCFNYCAYQVRRYE